ncbi:Rpn family recombination-promoting nuclease/putative transposase, partial [Thermoflexibacter ruber]
MIAQKYINPFTDFGFKKIFGEEANKDLLIDFLNELLTDKGKIIDLTYLKSEHLGTTDLDRKAIFDLYCENEKGEKFIVEMQRAKQDFFKDRSLYYATFPIQEQAKRGDWNYQLKGVYSIAITDFLIDDDKANRGKIVHDIRLIEKET